jgi:hypothetical protein
MDQNTQGLLDLIPVGQQMPYADWKKAAAVGGLQLNNSTFNHVRRRNLVRLVRDRAAGVTYVERVAE